MPREEPAFKIRNANLPLFVLQLNTTDMGRIQEQLEKRISQSPDFFSGAPVALGLSGIAGSEAVPDFASLIAFMRARSMSAAGVIGGSPEQRQAAQAAGLGMFPEAPAKAAPRAEPESEPVEPAQAELPIEAPPAPAEPAPAPEPSPVPSQRPTLVVDKPVRSGQRIYAEGANLVVLATVNPGAEIIADGDIHVYAPLRGRALAGARGSTEARVFVQAMEAELVAIAGYFQVFEKGIPDGLGGKAVQCALVGERVVLKELGAGR